MPDVKQKLTAEINADSRPMEKALDEAKRQVQSTAQATKQASAQTKGGYEQAARAAQNMGSAGASANMTVAQAMRHPIAAVRTLAAEAKSAALALLGMGQAGKNASAQTKEAGAALGTLLGFGSKMAIIAKGFQAIGQMVTDYIVKPIKEAYKGIEQLAKARFGVNSEIYGGQAEKWKAARKELEEYYALVVKANSADATNIDKLNAQNARRALERKGITVDTEGGTPEGDARKAIDDAQAKHIKALEGKVNEAAKAASEAERALEELEKYNGVGWRDKSAYYAERERLIGEARNYQNELDKVNRELLEARRQTPGEDFSRKVAAEAEDRLSTEMDRQAKASEEAAKRREDAEKKLAEAEERRAAIERQLADEGRLEAMQHTRDLLAKQMGRFGFDLRERDEENLAESVRDRIQRRRNVRLDARIANKLARIDAGENVHLSPHEKRRIEELRGLKAQDKGITAEEKAMQAAKKQEAAAKSLDDAAKAIQDAADEIKDATDAGEAAGKALEEARALLGKIEDERDFYELTATRGRSAIPDYGSILGQIRDILDGQSDRVYIVK